MSFKLIMSAVIKFLSGILLTFLLIFIPAGTLDYFGGWLFMGVLFIPMLILGIILLVKNPSLLEKRLSSKEKETEQKLVLKLNALLFLAGFILAGMDKRLGRSFVPDKVSYAAAALFFIGYIMYAEVVRENTFLSRTVCVQENQKVIDTGLYSLIRHPMYTSTIIMFLSIPFILKSYISLAAFIFYPFIIGMRIKNEEDVLEKELEGYRDYKKKVKYKMIPFVW